MKPLPVNQYPPPKDGTRIMVYSAYAKEWYFVIWKEDAVFGNVAEGPGWQLFDCEDFYYSVAITETEITHWMIEPPAPRS